MNKVILAIMTVLSVTGASLYMNSDNASSRMLSSAQLRATSAFTAWKMKHGKNYATNSEHSYRLGVFAENLKRIDEHNNTPGQTSTVGLNKFSDLPREEFSKKFAKGLKPRTLGATRVVELSTENLEDTVNWVTKGAVTGVKDQGSCGSCWAFSSTGAMEGAHFLASGELVSFSEEQLVQCSTVNSGCNGGLMDYAFQFYEKTAAATEADYPYTSGAGSTGSCSRSKEAGGKVNATGYSDVRSDSTGAQLKAAVAKGPVSVAIQADTMSFQSYTGGVITGSACGTNLDHGVLAVGYGVEGGEEYFLVKNSWGSSWGDNGFVKIGAANVCGITMSASYPTTD